MPAQLQEEVQRLEERLARLEKLVRNLYERLDVDQPEGGGGGWWGGADDDAPDPASDPEIQDLLAKGNKIQAVKRYHELSGLGLKEAQEAIERLDA